MILIVELIQLIINCGVFDIDDIILNILGIYIVYFVYTKKLKNNL